MQGLLYMEVSKNKDSITDFFLSILRNIKKHLFYKTSPMELEFVFKKVSFVGFHEKVFEWLVANEFLSNSTSLWWPIVANLNLNCRRNLKLHLYYDITLKFKTEINMKLIFTVTFTLLFIYCVNLQKFCQI